MASIDRLPGVWSFHDSAWSAQCLSIQAIAVPGDFVMQLNRDDYEQARQTRDPRFDGRIFIGVLTTGIYCRPICPVRVPKKENVQIYISVCFQI